MKISQIIRYSLSMPKTVYFNFRVLPIKQAIRLPIFISFSTKLLHMRKGCIILDKSIQNKPFSVVIGFNGTEVVPPQKSMISLKSGNLIFKGTCHIAEGCIIDIDGGVLTLGKQFSANRNFWISCNKSITFGDEAMLGWNITFFDATGHKIFKSGIEKEAYKPILIGNHVWIGSESHILKGAIVPDDSIVAYGSIVTKNFNEPHSIYGGSTAVFIQKDITWKK